MNILPDGRFGRLQVTERGIEAKKKRRHFLFFLCINRGIINCTGAQICVDVQDGHHFLEVNRYMSYADRVFIGKLWRSMLRRAKKPPGRRRKQL